MIDATCFIRSLCVLVQIVGADSQERNQGFHILQIQSDAVPIQSHFPQIGSHAADTVEEIAEQLCVSKKVAYALVKSGQFAYVRAGRAIRVSKDSFDKWLNQN